MSSPTDNPSPPSNNTKGGGSSSSTDGSTAVKKDLSRAIQFLIHPKVQESSVSQRAAFLEKKGFTKEETEEAMRQAAAILEKRKSASPTTSTTTTTSSAPQRVNEGPLHLSWTGNLVFASLSLPTAPLGHAQTLEALQQLDGALTKGGSCKGHVVSAICVVSGEGVEDQVIRKALSDWLGPEAPPPMVIESRLKSGAALQIHLVATRK